MKKITAFLSAVVLAISLCSCGDEDNSKIYQNFKNFISENGTEDNYYIRISKTADSSNVLTEASKLGNDCAFMEYDISGKIRYYRNHALTVVSAQTYFVPDKSSAEWEDFEFEQLNEKYRAIFEELLESDCKTTIEKSKIKDGDNLYSVTVKYDLDDLDANSIFSNSGNFGYVNVKFETDKSFSEFSEVSVNCQYDYNSTIYLYSVIFGDPNEPDENGENGQRPEDIKEIYEKYTAQPVTTAQ